MQDLLTPLVKGDWVRGLLNQMSANSAMLSGASGFFAPRLPSPWLYPTGSIEATSFYDASGLRNTLESLVDSDRINARETRFSVGAVNVRSGNFVYFDSSTQTIRPEQPCSPGRQHFSGTRSADKTTRHKRGASDSSAAGYRDADGPARRAVLGRTLRAYPRTDVATGAV